MVIPADLRTLAGAVGYALAALLRHGPRSEHFKHAAAGLGFAWRWWIS